MPSHIFFFIALAFIITHELDAIRRHEWRIFPGTSRLADNQGYVVFTLLHIPLFAILFYYLYTPNGLNQQFVTALNIFFITHLFLHVLALKHPKNEFVTATSWFIIVGAAFFSTLDIVF